MAPRPLPPIQIGARAGQYVERSAGLHLSTITQDILITTERDKYGKDTPDNQRWMNFLMGLVFERALEQAWLDREIEGGYRPELIRPGEVMLDGVIGTPDAFDTLKWRPEEYKCSKKSCRQPITDPKFWHYWVQLKAYAYMLGCTSGALYVLHVNGNYSREDSDPESGYVIRGWEDDWTKVELQENWDMLIRHARRRGWL